jgi:hypothetical protein
LIESEGGTKRVTTKTRNLSPKITEGDEEINNEEDGDRAKKTENHEQKQN